MRTYRNRQAHDVRGSVMAMQTHLPTFFSTNTQAMVFSPRHQARQGKQSADGLLGELGVLARAELLCAHIRICANRSEEHTSELQSLMRSSYAVFCLKTKT